MNLEERLLTAFRGMDDRSKSFMLKMVQAKACDCPTSPASNLRLVSSTEQRHHAAGRASRRRAVLTLIT